MHLEPCEVRHSNQINQLTGAPEKINYNPSAYFSVHKHLFNNSIS